MQIAENKNKNWKKQRVNKCTVCYKNNNITKKKEKKKKRKNIVLLKLPAHIRIHTTTTTRKRARKHIHSRQQLPPNAYGTRVYWVCIRIQAYTSRVADFVHKLWIKFTETLHYFPVSKFQSEIVWSPLLFVVHPFAHSF